MRIAVAMSGGVDSSVAAGILKEEGHDVIGLMMKTGVEAAPGDRTARSCCSLDDAWDAQRVADKLGIRFYALNYKEQFSRVLTDFAQEYQAGRTPNPCVRCNQWLKFGSLLTEARALGCDGIATGHYARLEERQGRPRLLRAVDPDKDQSYVLFVLAAGDLPFIRFPLGRMRKAEVREHARRFGLPVEDKPESQDLCFAPRKGYAAVLDRYRTKPAEAGQFVDEAGKLLGAHPGIEHFTVGQRKVGLAMGRPVYVSRIEPETRRVVMADEAALWSSGAQVRDVHWLSGRAPESPIRAQVQIRYSHVAAPATVDPTPPTPTPVEGGAARVLFDAPQRAITPGQAAVFYLPADRQGDGDEVLGGGWIGPRDP